MIVPPQRRTTKTRCERCRRLARSQLTSRCICQGCYRKEPKKRCARCGRSFHPRVASSAMCMRCTRLTELLASPFLVKCPKCQCLRVPHSWGSSWCQPCWTRRQRSYAHCSDCGRYKLLRVKSPRLCSLCYSNKRAPRALRLYVAQYTCPFAFNRESSSSG